MLHWIPLRTHFPRSFDQRLLIKGLNKKGKTQEKFAKHIIFVLFLAFCLLFQTVILRRYSVFALVPEHLTQAGTINKSIRVFATCGQFR
mgnify:CR=1 FL=1